MRLHPSWFELQATFATTVVELLDIPLREALRRYTTFYDIAVDNDAGLPPAHWDFDPRHAAWAALVEAVDGGVDPVEYGWRHLSYDVVSASRLISSSPSGRRLRLPAWQDGGNLAAQVDQVHGREALRAISGTRFISSGPRRPSPILAAV